MASSPYLSWIALAVLVIVHLAAGKLRFLNVVPRSRWLSIGSGISVAYAFVRLLPELSEHQRVLKEASGAALAFLEHHAYLVALSGLAVFYGIERTVKRSRRQGRNKGGVPSAGVFWLSIAAFAVYNALIGYLLLRGNRTGFVDLAFFTLAMALHFIVNDYGLHQHHKHLYTYTGRWTLSIAIIVGGLAGTAFIIPEPAIALVVAFLTGGIILNVLKEELPEDRESRFSAFALGAFGYTALLLTL